MGKGKSPTRTRSRGNPRSLYRGNLKFPLNTHGDVNAKVSFQAIEVIPPQFDFNFQEPKSAQEIDPDAGIDGTIRRTIKSVGGSPVPQRISPIQGSKVDLYLPISYQVTDGFQYDQAQLGLAGAAAAGTLQAGGSIGASVWEGIMEGGRGLLDFFTAMTGGEVSRLAAARGSQWIPVQSVRDAVGIVGRVAIKPNLRAKFNGVNIREFTFQFKLIPKSPTEASNIKSIIKFFRFHAYPEEIPFGKQFAAAFDYPNMFKIRLTSNGRNIGTPIKYCYLRSIGTTYNPTTPVLHNDGSPIETDLSLTFMEYKPLSRHDVYTEDTEAFYQENAGSGFNHSQMQDHQLNKNDFSDPTGAYSNYNRSGDRLIIADDTSYNEGIQ